MVREIADHKNTVAALCRDLGVERLFLFGSATRGTTVANVGDLDFAVQFRAMPPVEYAHNYFRLLEQLEALFKAPVDLVELDSIKNPYFKEEVDETKVAVYEIT
ncbi:MAG: nucleotidyltransferase domain-containing protein [Spirochaetia bacterium]|jgi:predicted nucleotidyltransferase